MCYNAQYFIYVFQVINWRCGLRRGRYNIYAVGNFEAANVFQNDLNEIPRKSLNINGYSTQLYNTIQERKVN